MPGSGRTTNRSSEDRTPGSSLLPAWASHRRVAHLATLSGLQPHVVAVVFCEFDGAVYVPIDGKRKSGRPLKRVANIQRNPAVSLLIDEYDEDWSKLRWLRIDGCAAIVATNAGLATALRGKYDQYRQVDGGATAIRIVVRQLRTWEATPTAYT